MTEESTTPDVVDLVRAAADAVNRGDVDSLMRLYAPEVVFDMSHVGGMLTGRASLRGFLEEWIGAYDELCYQLEELLDLGGGVVFQRIHQRGRPVGVAGWVEQREGWVVVLEEGLVARTIVYPQSELDEARAAAERLAKERG